MDHATPPNAEANQLLTFMEDVLVGESTWRLAEVRRLMELHTLISIGRWHADGLDHGPLPEPVR